MDKSEYCGQWAAALLPIQEVWAHKPAVLGIFVIALSPSRQIRPQLLTSTSLPV
jgi:hypothetical protein